MDYSCAFNYLGRLRRLSEVLDKPLRECDVDDIKLAMSDLAEKNLGEGKSYADGTRRQYLRTVEDFGKERGIDALSEIEVPSVKQSKIDEDWVLSKNEVWKLIENADKTRTKAIIAVCWECAWRSTALLSLTVGDYEEPNDQYALLSVPVGVTGDKDAGGNKKPLTIARGYVETWLTDHPCRDDDDAALFCRTDKEQYYGDHMSSEAVRKQLNKAARGASIEEDRVHIHCFRHARATYMKKSPQYDDMDIEHMLDWTEGTNQMKRYAHLNQDDKIASVLHAQGIEAETGTVDPERLDCPRCNREIPYDANSCPYCSLIIDERPADWLTVYREIRGEDDPIVKKYRDRPSTAPPAQALPPNEWNTVREVIGFAMLGAGLAQKPGYDEEIELPFDVDDIDYDALRRVRKSLGDRLRNYVENPNEYEMIDEDAAEQLRSSAKSHGLIDD